VNVCSVEHCDRPQCSLGLCNAHWQRRRRGVDLVKPILPRYKSGTVCSVEGCTRSGKIQLGFCNAHYIAFRKYGSPTHSEKRISRRGEPDAIPHGTASGYSYHKCRCATCRQFKRSEWKLAQAADPDGASLRRHESYLRNRDRALSSNSAWRSRNKTVIRAANVRNRNRYQSVTKRVAYAHGNRWTPNDDEVIRRADITTMEAAIILGRTYTAVTSRRYALRDES